VLPKAEEFVRMTADQTQALRLGALAKIEAGGVGHGQHRWLGGSALNGAEQVRSQQILRREGGMIQKPIGRASLTPIAGG
jgi:hypothetical protein